MCVENVEILDTNWKVNGERILAEFWLYFLFFYKSDFGLVLTNFFFVYLFTKITEMHSISMLFVYFVFSEKRMYDRF